MQAAGKRKDYGKFDLVVSYRPVRYLPSPKNGSCTEYMAGSVEVPLKLFLNDDGKDLELIIRYQKDIFTKEEAERLIRRVVFLMHQIVSYPETKIGDLQLLEEKEKQQIAEFQGEIQRVSCRTLSANGRNISGEGNPYLARRTLDLPAFSRAGYGNRRADQKARRFCKKQDHRTLPEKKPISSGVYVCRMAVRLCLSSGQHLRCKNQKRKTGRAMCHDADGCIS